MTNSSEKRGGRGQGETYAWIVAHVAHDGPDCLIWPFAKRSNGRGMMGHNGEHLNANRVMCEMVHGPAPSPRHEAAHECGNGHLSCIHPKHLFWKTSTENKLDTVKHGRVSKRGRRQKLTNEQVAEIRRLKGKVTQAVLMERFGVSQTTIADIQLGRTRTGGPSRIGRVIQDTERPMLIASARSMREEGKTWDAIAKQLGVARFTARTLASESA